MPSSDCIDRCSSYVFTVCIQYPLTLSVLPQATVLEEMPPFPERESSILAKLKRKKGPGHLPDIDDTRRNVNGNTEHSETTETPAKVNPNMHHNSSTLLIVYW